VLFIETEFQRLFAAGIKGEQIEIIISAAEEDAAAKIDSGINQGVSGAAIFRLDVVGGVAHFDVGVVTEKHLLARFDLRGESLPPRRNLSAAFDRLAFESLL
jgi:hypothetical protein